MRTQRARSIALHRAVLDHLRREPALRARAVERVRGWLRDSEVPEVWARAWLEWLALDLDELERRVLTESDLADDLRQVSPFAGVLPARERWQILREVEG